MDWIIVFFGLIILGLCVYITVIKTNTPEYIKLLEEDNKSLRKDYESLLSIQESYILMLEHYRKERERHKKEIEELNRLVG